MFDIKEEVRKLPNRPGVYLMKEGDTILYVGKAVNLKNRVRQYFQSSKGKSPKILKMISRIEYFEYIVCNSEMEALVLENNLIKENRPPYNTMLKDDKQYPYIKVTLGETYPRVYVTRTLSSKDGARYFGPYTNVGALRETLDMLNKIWTLRRCKRKLPEDIGKERPCLNYHIGQCMGPCTGKVTPEAYGQTVEQALALLDGHYKEIENMLTEKMMQCSDQLDFETAAKYRDRIMNLRELTRKQQLENAGSDEDRDVIGLAVSEAASLVQVFFIRGGKLIGREHFFMDGADPEAQDEILTAFIQQFYAGTSYIPRELLLPIGLTDEEILEDWLSLQKDQRVHLLVPQRGEKAKILKMAMENAQITLKQFSDKLRNDEKRTKGALLDLADCLEMEDYPERIEAYDISNTFGFESVGSMIVYENGKPKNHDYRKFRIQSVQGANDYASMKEVLTRRFRHAIDEMKKMTADHLDTGLGKFTLLPDLILMDGGKGQVHICQEVLDNFGLDIPVAGMVKDDHHRTRGLYYQDVEYSLDGHRDAFHLVTRIQDEAHRFAITYHKKLRSEKQVASLLDEVPGVGAKRRADLLKTFGSVARISRLTPEELTEAATIDKRTAQAIYDHFHQEPTTEEPPTEEPMVEETSEA